MMVAGCGFAQTWTQTGLINMNWNCFASSADGSTLVAAPGHTANGVIFVSTNGGFTWNTNALPGYYISGTGPYFMSLVSVATSADGTRLAGASVDGFLCSSTNTGATWITNRVPVQQWYAVASSADGTRLVAGSRGSGLGGLIFTSTNSGADWQTTSAPTNYWRTIASSADGTRLIAAGDVFGVYLSTNSGSSWIHAGLPPFPQWTVASSADGTKLVAADFADSNNISGHIFTSTDSGDTWVSNTLVSSFFQSVAISADGGKIVAASRDPYVLVSTNFGGSWVTNNLPGGGSYFDGVALSADGGRVVTGSLFLSGFGGSPGLSYLSQSVQAPSLHLATSPASFLLSWLVPSTNFVVQQSPDLITWSSITDAPSLNFTNLNNELKLLPTSSSGFFRLISQ